MEVTLDLEPLTSFLKASMLSLVMVEKVRVSDAQMSSWVGTCWRKKVSF